MTTQPEKVRSVTDDDIAGILLTNCGMDPDAAAATPDASLEELGLDSLAVLELQAVVAERYRVRIPDPDEAAQLSIGGHRRAGRPAAGGEADMPGTPTVDRHQRAHGRRVGRDQRPVALDGAVLRIPDLRGPRARRQHLPLGLAMFPDENGTVWAGSASAPWTPPGARSTPAGSRPGRSST